MALVLPLLLAGAVMAVLVPTVLVHERSRVFALELAMAGLLAALPGWIYLQFIKNKGQSLYDEYVLNLFRLHIDEYRNLPAPPQHTSYYALWKHEHEQLGTDTKDNLYRRKFEAVYGASAVSTFDLIHQHHRLRDRTEAFSPVFFATVLLCLGWVLFLQPGLDGELDLTGPLVGGSPQLPAGALQFGFLGAYSFILQDLIRRYFREDLRTVAYISAVARLVVVTVLVTALHLVWGGSPDEENLVAFLVGFFPQVGMQALQAAVAKPLGRLVPSIRTAYPLCQLNGLSIWYEARLAEEGVEDMQNLVSANLVDLLLRTRVPVCRLVDWIDQAYLYLSVPNDPDARAELQRIGIRTATGLEQAWACLGDDPGFRAAVSAALRVDPSLAADAVLPGLASEVNLWHVREFKRRAWLLTDRERLARPEATNGDLKRLQTVGT
jgi:hypothetical protein